MATTQIDRDSQIKPGSAYNWVTNDSTGAMSQTPVTASRAVSTDSNGLPTASVSTAAQLGYLQGLSGLVSGDIISINGGGNLSDAGIAASNLFLADGSVSATGNFNLLSHKITNLLDPTSAQDAATKNYVDNLINGTQWKEAAQAASTTNLTATYANGTAGVGATLTNSGTQVAFVIDGYTTAVNDRILVKNQITQLQNGIYTVTNIGSGSTNWVLTRSTDMDTPVQVPASVVLIEEGTTNQDTAWICTTQPTVTIGTTAITFVAFGAINTYFAGSGLDLSSNTFSITTDNSLTANAGNSNPSLVVKESVTGAIVTVADGIAVQLESSNPTLQINGSNQLGAKLNNAGAIVTGASGLTVNVDNSTIDIAANAIEVKAGGITNTQVSASAAIAFSKLASLATGHILAGNGGTVTDVTLSGDATIGNTGVLTLATVNGNVGSFGSSTSIPSFTVNAKGLITAASGNAVVAPAGTLSGTTLNSTVVTSSLTSLGAQSQALNMNSHLINNVTDPVSAQDAATKNYVDTNFLMLTGGTLTGDLTLANQHAVIFQDTGSNTVTLEAPTTITSSYTLKLPVAQGASSTVLSNDGSGNLSWAAALTTTLATNDIYLGNGSNVATAVPVTGDVSITFSAGNGVTSISSGLATHFVTREVPSGTINGTNVTFTLANTPTSGTECIYLNGLLQNVGGGNDYTISGATITFIVAPESGSVILVNYRK